MAKISFGRKLSEEFIEKFQVKINWTAVSYDRNLSDEFIEKFQDKIDWTSILEFGEYQKNFLKNMEKLLKNMKIKLIGIIL